MNKLEEKRGRKTIVGPFLYMKIIKWHNFQICSYLYKENERYVLSVTDSHDRHTFLKLSFYDHSNNETYFSIFLNAKKMLTLRLLVMLRVCVKHMIRTIAVI